MRKPVFRGDANWPAQLQRLTSLELLDLARICIILSRQQAIKALSDCVESQADLRLCCSHRQSGRVSHYKAHVFSI